MEGFSPSNLGSNRADPPMAAQQSDNFLPSSRRSVKKAIKIIRTMTPMRAFSKVLGCHRSNARLTLMTCIPFLAEMVELASGFLSL